MSNNRAPNVLLGIWTNLCEAFRIEISTLVFATDSNVDGVSRDGGSSVSDDLHAVISSAADESDEDEDEEVTLTTLLPQSVSTPMINHHAEVSSDVELNEANVYFTELSGLHTMISHQIAAVALVPFFNPTYSLNQLVSFGEIKEKKTIWARMVGILSVKKRRGSNCTKSDLLFGCPLDLVIKEQSIESCAAYGPGTVRIPQFLDECIKQLLRKGLEVK